MNPNPKIVGACLVLAGWLLLASCDRRSSRENDLEDRIVELEEENQYLRDQLEDAETTPKHARATEASQLSAGAERPVWREAQPRPPRISGEPRRKPTPGSPAAGDEDALEAAQRAVEDARNAEKTP